MPRKIIPVLLIVLAIGTAAWYVRGDHGPRHYTGFVEGEERIIRSEVSARVVAVKFAEGDRVPAGAVIAQLDDKAIQAQLKSKSEEIAALDADIRAQDEQITLIEATWQHDLSARRAELKQAESAAELASRTLTREQGLVKSGASTAQLLDDNRARRDQAQSSLDRAREMVARTEAQEREITLARKKLESMQSRRALAAAQRDELEIAHGKFEIHAPDAATVAQTQFIWPGELAQPGTAVLALLDPKDKYVQIYVPVADVMHLEIGQKVEIELDSQVGQRTPGEVSFIADKASFTPEKIETRSDRMGQVYRVKVRILENVERFQPGTEGNVYLASGVNQDA